MNLSGNKQKKVTPLHEPNIIKDEYLVKFANQFEGRINENVALQVGQLRNDIFSSFDIQKDSVLNEYSYAFKGFAAKLSKEAPQL